MPTLLALLPLILPIIEKMAGLFSSPNPPTQEEWDALKQDTLTTARMQALAVLANHGVSPESPEGKAFLSLIPTP